MKRLLVFAALLAFLGGGPVIAQEETSANVSIDSCQIRTMEDGQKRLDIEFRAHDIKAGEIIPYAFVWKAPETGILLSDRGQEHLEFRCFVDTRYAPEKPMGDTVCAKCRCYCADTKEKGCWRTYAYRTVQYHTSDGNMIAGVGVWHVAVVRTDTDEVMGQATIAVSIDSNSELSLVVQQ